MATKIEKFLSFELAQNLDTDLEKYSKGALKSFIQFYEIPFHEVSEEFGKVTKSDAIELIKIYAQDLKENKDAERLQVKQEKIATSKKVAPVENIPEVKAAVPSLPTDKKNYAREGFSKGNKKAQYGVGFALGMIGGVIATPYFLIRG